MTPRRSFPSGTCGQNSPPPGGAPWPDWVMHRAPERGSGSGRSGKDWLYELEASSGVLRLRGCVGGLGLLVAFSAPHSPLHRGGCATPSSTVPISQPPELRGSAAWASRPAARSLPSSGVGAPLSGPSHSSRGYWPSAPALGARCFARVLLPRELQHSMPKT